MLNCWNEEYGICVLHHFCLFIKQSWSIDQTVRAWWPTLEKWRTPTQNVLSHFFRIVPNEIWYMALLKVKPWLICILLYSILNFVNGLPLPHDLDTYYIVIDHLKFFFLNEHNTYGSWQCIKRSRNKVRKCMLLNYKDTV